MANTKFTNTISSIVSKVKNEQIKVSEIVEETFNKIEKTQGLNIFLKTTKEHSLEKAKTIDSMTKSEKDALPLAGVPIAIKDNICTRGIETTCSSKMLEGWIPPYDATVISKLNSAGAIMVGKTNLDEFAMGSSTENSAFGRTLNPWDEEKVCGGSSGGSAVAVASDVVPIALGSDTGGSIRQPASFTGIVGFKPSYGRISRYGLVAFGSSLDQIGPFANTVEDSAIAFSVLSGKDKYDSTSANVSVPNVDEIVEKLKSAKLEGKTVGVIKELAGEGYDSEVLSTLDFTKSLIENAGGKVVEVSIPNIKYCLSIYYILAASEASSNLSRFDGVRYGHRSTVKEADIVERMNELSRSEGFGEEVKRRIIIGTYALSAGHYDEMYGQAQRVRRMLFEDFKSVFESTNSDIPKCDVLMSPTSPILPFTAGEKMDDPLTMYLADVCTFSANLAGLPGLNLPVSLSASGLPIGIQLMANNFDEVNLLEVAKGIEDNAGFLELRKA